MSLENVKHEKFCQVWFETGNKSEAFRVSHPHSTKWKDETVHNKASALSKKDEVSARFKQLQDKALKDHGVTIATMNKAKLVGLDKHTETNVNVTVRNTIDDFYE